MFSPSSTHAHKHPAAEADSTAIAPYDTSRARCGETVFGKPSQDARHVGAGRTRVRPAAKCRTRRHSWCARIGAHSGRDNRRCDNGADVLESQCGCIGDRPDVAGLSGLSSRPRIGIGLRGRTGNDRCARARRRCQDLTGHPTMQRSTRRPCARHEDRRTRRESPSVRRWMGPIFSTRTSNRTKSFVAAGEIGAHIRRDRLRIGIAEFLKPRDHAGDILGRVIATELEQTRQRVNAHF